METIDYWENVAAITASVHQDNKLYTDLYEKLADDIGGFVGFFSLRAEAGKAFTEIGDAYTADGNKYYWLESIEAFTDTLIECLYQQQQPPKLESMKELARKAINANLIE